MNKLNPIVSIGMPVFNGGNYIAHAIEALLSQKFENFELIISDNASFDATGEICQTYADIDKRIRYIRQDKNIGALKNFLYVLGESKAKYFMWASVDDRKSNDFLSLNVEFLEGNPDYVASTSPTRFEGRDFDVDCMGDKSLDDDSAGDRIKNFCNMWHSNGRFYSLIRREVLLRFPFGSEEYLGADWIWVAYLAKEGKLKRLNNGHVILGIEGESNTSNVFKSNRKNICDWFFPFRRLSKYIFILLRNESFHIHILILISLLKLNWSAFKCQGQWLIRENRFYKIYKKKNF